MKTNKLILEQLDKKIIRFNELGEIILPPNGWIYSIRKAINMSLRQLGRRLNITPQSVKEIEEREKNGTISIKVLKQVARALDMKFVYGFVPNDKSLENMVEKRAMELAKNIVLRTSAQMNLEDQKISDERTKKAIRFKHRLVKIHLFPNGNGRHSRLCADILVSQAFNKPIFTWGGNNINDKGEIRTRYLNAIYEADKGNITPLLDFARS